MIEEQLFQTVGILEDDKKTKQNTKKIKLESLPIGAILWIGVIVIGCYIVPFFIDRDPSFMDLQQCNHAPGREFWFGTDHLGRDLFVCILYGGRVSISIGVLATVVSTAIAIIYGCISGLSNHLVDTAMMRFAEIILSIPNLLLVIFLQGIFARATVFSLAIVIGLTSWCSIAKVVRTQVKQIRDSEYVIAAKSMGGSTGYIIWKHLTPNILSSIIFMIVMNMRSAIVAESTLSFMGIGLPIEVISWGSLLSLSERAFLTRAWWMIFIPGVILIGFLLAITDIGNKIKEIKQ